MLKVFEAILSLTQKSFEKLVDLLTPSLLKKDTNMKECIKPGEVSCVALRYFASRESFRLLEYQFRISKKAVSYIIEEVAVATIKILGKTYLNTPTITDEWLKISQKFKELWNSPNGICAVDGKHIILQQPKNSGSYYRNYKGTDSIILLAMVDPEYEFLFADVGMNGRNSNGGDWSQSLLKNGFETNILNFQNPMPLPGCKNSIP